MFFTGPMPFCYPAIGVKALTGFHITAPLQGKHPAWDIVYIYNVSSALTSLS